MMDVDMQQSCWESYGQLMVKTMASDGVIMVKNGMMMVKTMLNSQLVDNA